MSAPKRVLFLGKADDPHTAKAAAFCRQAFETVEVHLGKWGDEAHFGLWEGDLIVSYLSRWVLADWFLAQAPLAINFHPATPEYPGIGGTNLALYDGAATFGATCHHMAARVDTGAIVKVARFPVLPTDTVQSLYQRTYDHQLVLAYEVLGLLAAGQPLPVSEEKWTRPPVSRREFEAFKRITPDMPSAEVARRVRANACPPYSAVLEAHGMEWVPREKAA